MLAIYFQFASIKKKKYLASGGNAIIFMIFLFQRIFSRFNLCNPIKTIHSNRAFKNTFLDTVYRKITKKLDYIQKKKLDPSRK